jgi:hypothetical protein
MSEFTPRKPSDIEELCHRIRDYVNAPRKQHSLMKNHDHWLQLCSSLDAIEDAEFAFTSYLVREFKNTPGAQYLAVYGLFQAFVIQQDAIVKLCQSLMVPLKQDDYPRLQAIRELRHISIGHPTKARGRHGQPDSYHFISRPTLGFEGFTLLSSDGMRSNKFQHVSTPTLIADQRHEIAIILTAIIDQLEEEDRAHRDQFRMEKLATIFPETLDYYVEKIFEGINRPDYMEMGALHLGLIQEIFDGFRTALERRGLELDAYDGIKLLYEETAYPLAELRAFFEKVQQGGEPKFPPQAARIFAWFLKSKLDELRGMAQEIDEDYAE